MSGITGSTQRIWVRAGRVYHLPEGCVRIAVLRGTAWLSMDGRDVVVKGGEQFVLPRRHGLALVSGMWGEDLFLALGVAEAAAA